MLSNQEYNSIDDKYIILKSIGEGGFAKVFLVYEKDANAKNQKYAAKVLFKNDEYFDIKIEIINKIKNLQSPYIINIITSGKGKIKKKGNDNDDIIKQYVIYEYASKKSIYEYLIFANSNNFEEKYAKIIFKYILKGFQAMHNASICHRDIKLGNILLDENFKPKICDFGFTCKYNKNIKLKGRCGTHKYCSPEIMRKEGFQGYDGIKADIFSLGITLLLMVLGIQKKSEKEFIKYKEEYDFDSYLNKIKILINDTSKEFQDLIIKMIDFNPEKRPSIENILDDPWMKVEKENEQNQDKEIYEEFKRREKIMEENKISIINKEIICDNPIKRNKSLIEENTKFFEHEFVIKNIKESKLELRDYLIINGAIKPIQLMDLIIYNLKNEIKDGYIQPNKDYYIIDINFEYDEEEENDEDLSENGEEGYFKDKYGIYKKDLFIQIILFEYENGNHILQFYKNKGEIEDYYQKLENIISIIKNSLKEI